MMLAKRKILEFLAELILPTLTEEQQEFLDKQYTAGNCIGYLRAHL